MLSAAYYEEYSACHYYDTCCVEDCCTDATGGWKDCTSIVDYLNAALFIYSVIIIKSCYLIAIFNFNLYCFC